MNTSNQHQTKYLPEYLFWLIAIALLFIGLGDAGLFRSESRWAEIVREMIQTGQYFNPTLNGESYFDKPLLSYWLVVVIHGLTGQLNEWTLRLPSAISGLVVLWSTWSLGKLLWDRQVALTAAWLLLLSYGFLGWARLGEADMENLAVISLSVYWYWKHRDSTRFFDYLVFYALIFIGAHAKGLAAITVPGLVLLPDLLTGKRWIKHINPRQFSALTIGFGLYLLPFLLIAANSSDHLSDAIGLVIRENLQRFFNPFDHIEPFYIYLIHWPTLMLPWAPLMVFGLVKLTGQWKNLASQDKWVLLALLLIFVFFSASGSRRIYYILPILPYTTLALASCLKREANVTTQGWGIRLEGWLIGLLIALEILSWFAWPVLEAKKGIVLPEQLRLLGLIPGILAALTWFVAWKRRQTMAVLFQVPEKLAMLLLPTLVLLGGYFLWQQPMVDKFRSKQPFGLALKETVQSIPAQQIGLAVKGRPPLKVMFYAQMPFPAQRLHSTEEIQSFLDKPGYPKLLLLEGDYIELPAGLASRSPDLAETIYPWEKRTKKKLRAWFVQQNRGD